MLSGTFFRDSVLFFFSRQLSTLAALVCAENLNPNVVMVKSAKHGRAWTIR